jgi:hypothetical protein
MQMDFFVALLPIYFTGVSVLLCLLFKVLFYAVLILYLIDGGHLLEIRTIIYMLQLTPLNGITLGPTLIDDVNCVLTISKQDTDSYLGKGKSGSF